MRATISILGMYNYDNTIFDNFTVPSNFEDGAKEAIINNILVETGELESLYTNPDFMKQAIGLWCSKYQLEWEELRKTQLYEYNPIWNADYNITDDTLETRDLAGTNDTTETYTRALNEDFTRGLNENNNGSSSVTSEIKDHTNKHTGHDTTENSVYSYNNNTNEQPRDKSKITYNSTNTEDGTNTTDTEWSTSTTQTGGTTTTQTGGTTNVTDNDSTDTGTIDTAYNRYLRGNYGQTTTQQMINEQRELVKFNLYNYIIGQFKERFCILVY